jgi:phosphonopyruvate decarboxylase
MISSSKFFNCLRKNGISFFTGVPDSLLKSFCAYVADNTADKEHIIAANEGGAVALAAGYHLSTGKIPLVYLQNSGLGNMINPLMSLVDKEVYSIPMVIVVGWRGKPGRKDEPQHVKQGRIQNELLKVLDIPFVILSPQISNINSFVKKVIKKTKQRNSPAAIIVEPDTFEKYKLRKNCRDKYQLTREQAIRIILQNIPSQDLVISTTGKTSREVYECREHKKESHQRDFLTIGSMGHVSQIALGVALNTKKKVVCLDGDGAVLMHMGALAIIGTKNPKNFLHIVLNNGCHDSVGGQPTVGFNIDITKIAKACGYANVKSVKNRSDLEKTVKDLLAKSRPSLIEVIINSGARKDLGRPKTTPVQNKVAFMDFLRGNYE